VFDFDIKGMMIWFIVIGAIAGIVLYKAVECIYNHVEVNLL
jgi:hypothetical protein